MTVQFLPSGDTGLMVQFDGEIDPALGRRVVSLGKQLADTGLAGFIEAVPSYRSLLVHYNPLLITQDRLISKIESLLQSATGSDSTAARQWKIPVCFDHAEFARDLDEVAAWADMSPDAVIEILLTSKLYVYMIGFAAGQPYLGDFPDTIAIPRRANPVPHMPEGSVLIATGKAVIYPCDNPTGWFAVGRTPVKLFDLQREPSAFFSAGDTVEFERIDYEQFNAFDADSFQPVSGTDL